MSVVLTVKDEQAAIEPFLSSLLSQSRRPDEIVVVDGGSGDGTLAALTRATREEERLQVISAPGASISRGRNLAIERAGGPIIAVTDAGTELDPYWLETLVRPLEETPPLAVSSGFFIAGGSTWFERCLATVITPQLQEIDPRTFLPSSRSIAFRRSWWERVGGYPEWLRHCEDLVFDLELRKSGARFWFTPNALVTWNSRPNLLRFFRQYFDYARGDGHAHLWTRRHVIRYTAYATGFLLARASRDRPPARLALLGGLILHLSKYFLRIHRRRPVASRVRLAAAFALVPVIVVTGDVAKMAGYPIGLAERRRVRASCASGVFVSTSEAESSP